jgi:dehydrogenase/reductase SDR family member 7B
MVPKGKIIWITGASSGIGEALALELAKDSNTLILSARNLDALEGVKQKCEDLGAKSIVIPIDLASEDSIAQAFKLAKEQVKSVDILVNNGGISQRSYVLDTPLDIDRKIFEINFFGTVALTKLVLPWMIENGGGKLAAMSSMVGRFGFPLRSAYSSSKHALHGFFESLYLENHQRGIRTLMICPGRIKTQLSVKALKSDGAAYQKIDDGQANGISAERCAKKIAKALKRNKREVWVGGTEILMMYFRKYIPALFFKIAKNIKET